MTTPDSTAKFNEAFRPYAEDFESINLRVIVLKQGDDFFCLSGRALLMDVPPSNIERYDDIFSSPDVEIIEEVLPVERLPDLVDQLVAGEITIQGRRIRLGHEPSAGNVQFSGYTTFWLGHRVQKNGFHISWWGLKNLQQAYAHEYLQAVERRMGGYGKGYKDLTDLAAAFIPGQELDKGRQANFHILVPINIDAQGRFHEKSLEFTLNVGRRIKLDKLRFVALLREEPGTRSGGERTAFVIPKSGWKSGLSGFRAKKVVPRKDERACELLMVYQGQTVATHFAGLYPLPEPESDDPEINEGESNITRPPLGPGQTDELVLLRADFAGSSKLKQELGVDEAKPLLDDWEVHFRGLVPLYGGYVMAWSGDGGLACFRGEGKHENGYAAAQHLLFYALARMTRPISGLDSVSVRVALHAGVIKWELDPGSIKSGDIDVVCHAESDLVLPNSIGASETFLKKCPARLKKHFKPHGKIDGETFRRTDLSIIAGFLAPKQKQS